MRYFYRGRNQIRLQLSKVWGVQGRIWCVIKKMYESSKSAVLL